MTRSQNGRDSARSILISSKQKWRNIWGQKENCWRPHVLDGFGVPYRIKVSQKGLMKRIEQTSRLSKLSRFTKPFFCFWGTWDYHQKTLAKPKSPEKSEKILRSHLKTRRKKTIDKLRRPFQQRDEEIRAGNEAEQGLFL